MLKNGPQRASSGKKSGPKGDGRQERRGERGPYAPGLQRRRELMEAVLRIVARDGVSSVTHRAVAAEADASLRATTYYFATKEDMIREAFRFFCEQSIEQIETTSRHYVDRNAEPADAVALIFETVVEESNNPNTSWAAEFELVLAIAREPAFAPEYRAFQERLDEGLQTIMRRIGSRRPTRDARIVLAFLRGFELEQLSRPDRKSWQRRLKADLTHLVAALVEGGG